MSDIHGFIGAFKDALRKVDLSGENKLILLGDYIDYGPESRDVLETIIELQKTYGTEKVIALFGNHEKDFLDWYEEYSNINRHFFNIEKYSNKEWLQSDQDADYETLKSFLLPEHWEEYAEKESMLSSDSRNAEAVRLLQEDADEIIRWLQGLEYFYETDKQIFVHAGIAEWVGEDWQCVTSDDYMVRKSSATKGSFVKDIIAGHISTAKISGDKNYYGVFHDGDNHYYLDGSTYRSGRIPVLVYDTEKATYYEEK